ncbi:isoprenyl transferase [Pseudomonadota bacterium]
MATGETEVEGLAKVATMPRHVAIIMDGNGRWAKQQGLPRPAGHRAGVESVRSAVEYCAKQGIEVLTLFAFSSENWRRPKKEVGMLLELFVTVLQREVKRLHKNKVRIKIIGDCAAFPEKLQQRIRHAEELTVDNTGLVLQIAANYGGRWDIAQAAQRLAEKVKSGEIEPQAMTEEALAEELSFAGLPDPDLFIRTGGEQRVSNFLLWQAAYAELYFTDTLWPDFDAAAFDQAVASYTKRERRFGQTSEQVEKSRTLDPVSL